MSCQAIRNELLKTLLAETDKNVRNKISDAVAEIARQYYDSSSSRPDFPPELRHH